MAIIGSAEVEVRADVRKLSKDVKDSFDGLEKQADQIAERMGKSIVDSIKNNLDGLTVRINIDEDHFLDQLVAIEGMLNDVSDKRVKVDVDTSELTTLNESVDRVVNSIPDIDIKPTVSSSSQREFMADVDSLLDRARAAAAAFDSDIPFNADIDQALNELERLKQEIEDLKDQDIELAMALDQSDVEQINLTIEALRQYNQANDIELGVDVHIAKAMAEIALLTKDRRMNIFPQIGGKFVSESAKIFSGLTGINVMREDFRKFVDSLTQLDERLGPLAMQLTALSAAVPTAGALGGWAVTLLGDLGSLSGLVVPLAGILGGATIGFGTLALALSGTGDRLKDLNPRFEKFRDTISNTYWGAAEKPFRNMVSKVLPPLQTELKTTATALGEMSESLFDAVVSIATTGDGAARFSTLVGNTNRAIVQLGPAFEPFLSGLLTVSAVGSQYLPQISDWLVKIGEGFDAWATESAKTGEMQQWMDDAIEVMMALFSILGDTVGIMRTLYNVAKTVGFPGVRELADGFERVNEALKQPQNIKYMEDLGRSVMIAFGSITSGLAWIGPLIQTHSGGINRTIETMGRIVGSVLEGIGNMLTNTGLVDSFFGLFDSLETAVTAFEPVWENLGNIFAVTLDALGSAFENLTPVFVEFFDNLENDANLVKPALMGVLDVIGEWGPVIMEMVGEVTGAIFEFIGSLSPYTILLGAAFMAALPAITAVAGAFTVLWNIGSKVWGILGTIAGAMGRTGGAGGLLSSIFQRLSGGLGGVLSRAAALVPGIGWIIAAFVSAFAASEDLRKGVGDFLVNAFKTLAAFVQPIIGPIGELFGTLMDGLSQIGSAVAPAFTGLFNALNSIMPVIQLVAHFLGAVLGGAIKNLSTVLGSVFNSIGTIVGGLANILGGAFNAISSIITGVIEMVKGLISGDMSAVADAAKNMWNGIQDAWGQMLGGAVQAVVGVFTGAADLVMSSIKGMFEQALHVLDTFDLFPQAQAIIQSLVDGFGSAVEAVRTWLQELTQNIIEWKGPPANDATLLNEAGASIIQSLVDGFASAVEAVFSFLQGLTQQIVDVVMNVVNAVVGFFQTGWGMLVTVVQTVWNGIVLIIQTVLTTVMTVVQTYITLVVTIFQTGWNILTTVVQTVWNFIVTIIQTVFTTIMTVIQTYIAIVVTIFQTGWNILTTVIQAVWLGIQTVIQAAWATIQIIIQTALTIVVTIFTTVWNTVLTVVMTVWSAISNAITLAINTVRNIISTVMSAIMTVISTIWNTIKTVTLTVWNAIKALITLGLAAIKAIFTGNFAAFRAIITTAWNVIKSTTQSVWNTIKSAISSVINTIRSTIQSVFNSIRSTITSIMNGIRSTIQSVWNTIRSAISSAVNTVRSVVTSAFNAVRSIITSVMNTARSIISSVWSSIRSTVSSAVNNVRSAVSSGFNALRGIVSSAWNAVVSAVTSAVSRMMGIVRGIPGKIRGALGNLGGLLTGAGRSIIQGLINGVTGMIGTLRNKFSSITNMIPDWKGPPDTDAKLLTNAGELIMEGLISGLESKYGAVKNSLQTFTGDLSQTVGTQIGADVGITTAVRNTALSDAERRLSYRSNTDSMVQSGGGGETHIHFHQAFVNEEEVIMAVNRELGRG